ncbi:MULTISPECIES: hypothetical protein [Mesorhizobium]|uniref:Uncharacterized protein n=1 Tax=Mesorhizobium shonense TaxID=1209948 RepID=A0ABV2I2B9_9HYPH|nr:MULTISPECIES: hypothetical protein [unclassified Mesorhizobium]AZO28437.1 hypothetical protein EJ071_14190 [Mesorhizobium sp. M1B.F.Ca.ET.045.04.1.1]RWA66191.1 MAG: hypothetical protein EOQ29_26425 [Mesorhizobium sp.]RWA81775.1 MAG: hypothetical protein EOQ30_18650 [Mesorhizobium sp.]RWB18673.1 MAG: hypothetical protein EOQ40_23625 [Mesorhizobium sp.]TIS45531.1 MAG: hypothetical protein E5W96_30755 [Mesorhizobium sp.]
MSPVIAGPVCFRSQDSRHIAEHWLAPQLESMQQFLVEPADAARHAIRHSFFSIGGDIQRLEPAAARRAVERAQRLDTLGRAVAFGEQDTDIA